MDRAFIISGVALEGREMKSIAGVLFSNSAPDMRALSCLGFDDIQSFEEVAPLSRQPTEPTLYLFCRSPAPSSVEVVRLDWSNGVVNRVRVGDEPSVLIPAVRGAAAERFLYAPKAYIISANVKEQGRSKPVVAVFFIKPQPGERSLQPDKKTLNRLGLVDIQFVELVSTAGQIECSMLYVFEKTPAAKTVLFTTLAPDGKAGESRLMSGEPHTIIPPISGSAADRLVNPRNGLGKSDFPKEGGRSSSAPPESRRAGSTPPSSRRTYPPPPLPPKRGPQV